VNKLDEKLAAKTEQKLNKLAQKKSIGATALTK
jgi:hypothetical protein